MELLCPRCDPFWWYELDLVQGGGVLRFTVLQQTEDDQNVSYPSEANAYGMAENLNLGHEACAAHPTFTNTKGPQEADQQWINSGAKQCSQHLNKTKKFANLFLFGAN